MELKEKMICKRGKKRKKGVNNQPRDKRRLLILDTVDHNPTIFIYLFYFFDL